MERQAGDPEVILVVVMGVGDITSSTSRRITTDDIGPRRPQPGLPREEGEDRLRTQETPMEVVMMVAMMTISIMTTTIATHLRWTCRDSMTWSKCCEKVNRRRRGEMS